MEIFLNVGCFAALAELVDNAVDEVSCLPVANGCLVAPKNNPPALVTWIKSHTESVNLELEVIAFPDT